MHKLKLFSSHLSIIPDNKRLNKQDNKNIPKLVLGKNTHKKMCLGLMSVIVGIKMPPHGIKMPHTV